MFRLLALVLSTACVLAASCARHPVEETKYFFTHHFSKAEKKERKAEIKKQLEGHEKPVATLKEGSREGRKLLGADEL